MDFSFLDFFFTKNTKTLSCANKFKGLNPYCHAVLYGGEKSGKTSLLFQMAVNVASTNKYVIFICSSQEKMHKVTPLLCDDCAPSTSTLSRILIYYFPDDLDLRLFFVRLHCFPTHMIPDLIIIDDFSEFFSSNAPTVNPPKSRGKDLQSVF